jgi:hypothetical protein
LPVPVAPVITINLCAAFMISLLLNDCLDCTKSARISQLENRFIDSVYQ